MNGAARGRISAERYVCQGHSYFISPFFEVKVGEGRLIVCGLNIDANSTAARLFKRALWRYVASVDFDPKWRVPPEWFTDVFLKRKGPKEMPVKLDADAMDMMNENRKDLK